MKAIIFQVAHFRLPDDFHGGISDALRALADYHDHMTGAPEQEKKELSNRVGEMTFKQASAELFDRFLDEVKTGRRFVGTVQIVSYDPVLEDLPALPGAAQDE